MPAPRKIFRIEAIRGAEDAPALADPAPTSQALLAELKALRELIERQYPSPPGARMQESAELRVLKEEIATIHRAIDRTRQELATLRNGGLGGINGAVERQLGEVAAGSERATQQILNAAEEIDQAANTLSATVKGEQQQGLTQDIREQVILIFEACNFQDLAGQRIAKVLTTFRFVEERIARMVDILGGIEAVGDTAKAPAGDRKADVVPISGPKLDGEDGHISQAEIDALFA